MTQTNGKALLDKWFAQKTNCLARKDGLFRRLMPLFFGIPMGSSHISP